MSNGQVPFECHDGGVICDEAELETFEFCDGGVTQRLEVRDSSLL